ncbi:3-hydroxyacyl-CoA dehydrogenase NAD-binding domain-containing protein [Ostreiculturibacter nitratireducens]|uniref:3-hydroxyacyl-CoA dehydrogenase NAD-binding domain-containing protein n=1 Tax=Ostreiculturibacter nitratireducens TaxID=3075226 RepID=UPI0031B634AF
MTEGVRIEVTGPVAEIVIDNPPVNAIGRKLRLALVEAFDAVEADPAVQAVVLSAAGRTWPVGADIREFGLPPEAPLLPDVCNRIADCEKPVVAALHGNVLGGGLELALGARYRIAPEGTRFGFPEVALGLIPGAGGTQRLPRLVGAGPALDMILSGAAIGTERALEIGLIDAVGENDIAAEARALASEFATLGQEAYPAHDAERGLKDPATFVEAVDAARARLRAEQLPAPARIVDCVEAALLLPFESGMAFERAAFEDLLASPESAALRHAFLAERRAARVPEASATPRDISHVGVVGGGMMGAGITSSLLSAGLRVTLVERDVDALSAGLAQIAKTHERAVAKGRLTPAARGEEWSRLRGSTDLQALAPVDLVIEAVTEDEEVKREVFARLDGVLRPGAILASNTSYLDIDRIADATQRPGDVIGLHFFAPAPVMRLLEVVVAERTAPEIVATAFDLARRLGKVAVRAGVCDGFIGNRILTAYRTAADFLMEDGASPYQIDAAMKAYGFPMGPYAAQDLSGLDISWARRKRLAATRDPARRYVAIGDHLCEAGRLGRKAGRGYYLYPEGARDGQEDPEVLALISRGRLEKGITPRRVSSEEIRARCVAAMANEGARILEEGVALRPSDIDVVMLLGFGFPRHRGGPMQAADQRGLLALRNELRGYAAADGPGAWLWQPGALWDELIKNGKKFASLNGD